MVLIPIGTMQLFLHAMCSAHTLDFHLYATKMLYMYSCCCYRRRKKGTVQKMQRSIKRDKTPEKNFPTLSFVYRSSSKDWSVSLFLLCAEQTSLKPVQDPGHTLYGVKCFGRLVSNLGNGSNLFSQFAQAVS